MYCPVCKDERLVVSERSGIEIDYCPKCRGVWLDRGELDKIIERSSMPYEGAAKREYQGDLYGRKYDDGRDKKYHKKESFWSELFD